MIAFALALVLSLASFSPAFATASPLTDRGTQPPLNHGLEDPMACATCHSYYDSSHELEPWNSWAGSMMAQSSRDPIFWAALDVANHDLPGVGDFCLRCHVPTGWLAGRSEAPGGSPDGCGLVGFMDLPSGDLEGVSCHLCHRMMVNSTPPAGEDSVYFENGQFWIDDGDCDGLGEPCRHGPYQYPLDGFPPPHAWLYSTYVQDSGFCGNCHNVTSPVHTLITDGVDTGVPFPIERTFREWSLSEYADSTSAEFQSCQDCHMPQTIASPAFACGQQENDRTGNLGVHQFAGGNAWIPDVLRQEYPNLGLSESFEATRDWALDMLQNRSAEVEVAAPDSLVEGGELPVEVKITNLTGHKLPTGYPEGRRMWIHVQVRDGTNAVIWESGAYDASSGVLAHDAQLKIYESKQGIWNANGTGECDCEDSGGSPMFHFVLNDCVALDNRIPPLGFRGASDPETNPVGYAYPETSPGSGVLVNYDVTEYAVPVPLGVVGPLNVVATLRYQTTSKEYVEFLLDESVTHGFPDDCIERSDGLPGQTRAEILHEMWETHGRAAPVDMAANAGSVEVLSASGGPPVGEAASLSLSQNYPNPIRGDVAETRIAYRTPHAAHVTLDVMDVAGRHIRRLVSGAESAGAHSVAWDRRDEAGRPVVSGVYLYRLAVDGKSLSKRMIVIR